LWPVIGPLRGISLFNGELKWAWQSLQVERDNPAACLSCFTV
jgi:hypothetical protein